VTIPKELLDTLMQDYKNPEDLIGETGLLKQLTKQLLERAMQAEVRIAGSRFWALGRSKFLSNPHTI
jgi:hypothetical protein